MDALTITGRVVRGKLDGDKSLLNDFLKHAEGKWVSATFKIGRPKASHAQFKWYRGIALPMLAAHLGYDFDEYEALHEGLLIKCYGAVPDKLDGRPVPAHRTRQSDTKEMAAWQDWIIRFAAKEFGLVIPDPIKRAA